jgi:hypothetical protein
MIRAKRTPAERAEANQKAADCFSARLKRQAEMPSPWGHKGAFGASGLLLKHTNRAPNGLIRAHSFQERSAANGPRRAVSSDYARVLQFFRLK